MKKELYQQGKEIQNEIENLYLQIEQIEKPSCSNPINMNYVFDLRFVEKIKKSVIDQLKKRIKELESQFEKLK